MMMKYLDFTIGTMYFVLPYAGPVRRTGGKLL